MPDFTTIIAFLVNASPYGAAALVIIAGLWLFLRHREVMRRLDAEDSAKTTGKSLQSMLASHISFTESLASEVRQCASTELQVLHKIAQELVALNAQQTTALISADNAKIIINSQWAWVRDESSRLIVNSIQNNNFHGNEAMVAGKVSRAWRRVSRKSEDYMHSLEGLRYPYEDLYSQVLPLLWSRMWDWAVPIYHRDFASSLPAALEDLQGRITVLFDAAIDAHFDLVEDIDDGVIYNRTPDSPLASGEYPMHEACPDTDMANRLSTYAGGDTPTKRVSIREEIRLQSGSDRTTKS